MMFYSCTNMTTVGIKGLIRFIVEIADRLVLMESRLSRT